MPPITISQADVLREINHRLLAWVEAVSPGSGPRRTPTPEDIAALLSVLSAGAANPPLSTDATERDRDYASQLHSYRRHLQRIQDMLPSIHGQLLAERSRLETQRSRVRSALEWVRATRQTL